ncbi:MAG: hypothetical protein J6T16_00250 [Opitutales bacterium]|nr:hypothetical protein [Opitutales bacterium]
MEIGELLPHAKPMIVLDEVVGFDLENSVARASFTVKPSDVFFEEDLRGIAPHFALEYMAQAIGVFVGLWGKARDPDFKQEIGFVLGSRKMMLNVGVFEEGKTYFVEAKKVFFDSEMASFDCAIYGEDKNLCASATVNAFKPGDPLKYINQNNG